MSGVGRKNFQDLNSNYTRQIRDYGVIDAGATDTILPVLNKFWLVNQHQNYLIQILTGGAFFEWGVVSSNTGDTITLGAALTTAPAAGDIIIIYDLLNSSGGSIVGETVNIATTANISGGVTAALGNYNKWSLYFNVAGAIDITVELSPDGGVTYYDIGESPISFAGAGDAVYEMGYTANYIRLTGSDGTLVTAQVRGNF